MNLKCISASLGSDEAKILTNDVESISNSEIRKKNYGNFELRNYLE